MFNRQVYDWKTRTDIIDDNIIESRSSGVPLQRGQLEDVVVNDTYRGKQLGKL